MSRVNNVYAWTDAHKKQIAIASQYLHSKDHKAAGLAIRELHKLFPSAKTRIDGMTWGGFCLRRLDCSKTRAMQLEQALEVVEELESANVEELPSTEYIARQLHKILKDRQPEVWLAYAKHVSECAKNAKAKSIDKSISGAGLKRYIAKNFKDAIAQKDASKGGRVAKIFDVEFKDMEQRLLEAGVPLNLIEQVKANIKPAGLKGENPAQEKVPSASDASKKEGSPSLLEPNAGKTLDAEDYVKPKGPEDDDGAIKKATKKPLETSPSAEGGKPVATPAIPAKAATAVSFQESGKPDGDDDDPPGGGKPASSKEDHATEEAPESISRQPIQQEESAKEEEQNPKALLTDEKLTRGGFVWNAEKTRWEYPIPEPVPDYIMTGVWINDGGSITYSSERHGGKGSPYLLAQWTKYVRTVCAEAVEKLESIKSNEEGVSKPDSSASKTEKVKPIELPSTINPKDIELHHYNGNRRLWYFKHPLLDGGWQDRLKKRKMVFGSAGGVYRLLGAYCVFPFGMEARLSWYRHGHKIEISRDSGGMTEKNMQIVREGLAALYAVSLTPKDRKPKVKTAATKTSPTPAELVKALRSVKESDIEEAPYMAFLRIPIQKAYKALCDSLATENDTFKQGCSETSVSGVMVNRMSIHCLLKPYGGVYENKAEFVKALRLLADRVESMQAYLAKHKDINVDYVIQELKAIKLEQCVKSLDGYLEVKAPEALLAVASRLNIAYLRKQTYNIGLSELKLDRTLKVWYRSQREDVLPMDDVIRALNSGVEKLAKLQQHAIEETQAS